MGRNETRLKELEKVVSPKEEYFMYYFSDIQEGEPEPPEDEIEVFITYLDNRKNETMSMTEYKKRFPEWEEHTTIKVSYEEEPIP